MVSRGNPMHEKGGDSTATFPASAVVSPVAPLAGGESKGASAAGAGGTDTHGDNATTVIRGKRTKSIAL